MSNKFTLLKMLIFQEINIFKKREGASDFLKLFFFYCIVFILSLLILSTNNGLLDSLVDTFLSKNRDGNIPVYVTTGIFENRPISKDILKDFKDKTSLDTDIFFETLDDSVKLYGFNSNKIKKWIGKSVLKNSYFWQKYTKGIDTNSENTIVLNRSNFKKYFKYSIYKKNISQRVKDVNFPKDFYNLKYIYLETYFNRRSELVKYKIVWADNIYDIKDIDFLLPMDIIAKIKYKSKIIETEYGKKNRDFRDAILNYLPLTLSKETLFIKTIKLKNKEDLDKLSKLIPGKIKGQKYKFNKYMGKSYLDSVLKGIDYNIIDDKSYSILKITNSEIVVNIQKNSLDNLNTKDINKSNIKIEKDKNNIDYSLIKVPLTEIVFITDMVAYAKGRENIYKTRRLIENYRYKNENHNFFMIDKLYSNSLKKLGFLTDVLEALKIPFAIILIFIFIFLLFNQIKLIIDIRKSKYAILIAKGLKRVFIFWILTIELSIIMVISAMVSFGVLKVLSFIINSSIKDTTKKYIDIVDISNLNILPINFNEFIFVFMFVFLISIITSIYYLRKLNILNKNGYIGELLKG